MPNQQEIGELKQAKLHLDIMQQVFEKDEPVLRNAQTLFKRFNALHKFQVGLSRLSGLAKRTSKSADLTEIPE